MAPRSQREQYEDELRDRVDAARMAYERARLYGGDTEKTMDAWKTAMDAFVAAVLPRENQ